MAHTYPAHTMVGEATRLALLVQRLASGEHPSRPTDVVLCPLAPADAAAAPAAGEAAPVCEEAEEGRGDVNVSMRMSAGCMVACTPLLCCLS